MRIEISLQITTGDTACADQTVRLRSLLASWTDIDEPDVFTKIAAGKSFLRPDDLAALAALIDEVERGHGD